MHVTQTEFRENIRLLRSETKTLGKELNGYLVTFSEQLDELKDIVEKQQYIINMLLEKAGIKDDIII